MKFDIGIENLASEERAQLLSLIEKANKKKDEQIFIPSIGECYYYIDGRGKVYRGGVSSKDFADVGNCFRSMASANKRVKQMKIIAELREIADKINSRQGIDGFNYGHSMESIYVGKDGVKPLLFNCLDVVHLIDIAFRQPHGAEEAIKIVGEDRIMEAFGEDE